MKDAGGSNSYVPIWGINVGMELLANFAANKSVGESHPVSFVN